MNNEKIFSEYQLGNYNLSNRIVMAPMTRSRAIGNVPNAIMALYYNQRSSAGLIITEGTSPSPNGLGYSRIPGIFSKEQVEGWKLVTSAVHKSNGKIFVQLMHTGRISHKLNLPAGAVVLAPSAVKPSGTVWTDSEGMQEFPTPKEMTTEELKQTKAEYVQAARNAVEAGFDGVELHGANGYLLEQFLSPFSNTRTDEYGGSIKNRCRFILEVATEVAAAIGKEKTGIRLSPFGVASDMSPYPEIEEEYEYLAGELNKIGILYIHVVDHSAMGAPTVPLSIKEKIRSKFANTLILAGGYDLEKAEKDLDSGASNLIAIGRQFLNNPDLVLRLKNNKPLATNLDMNTFYTPGEKGYTDYPSLP